MTEPFVLTQVARTLTEDQRNWLKRLGPLPKPYATKSFMNLPGNIVKVTPSQVMGTVMLNLTDFGMELKRHMRL